MNIIDYTIVKQMDERRNQLRYPNGPLAPSAPITGTEDTFDASSMINLDRMTDGDLTTYAGTGTKTLGGSGTVGNIYFDLGSVKNVLIELIGTYWSNSGGLACYLQYKKASGDGYSAMDTSLIGTVTSTSETHIQTRTAHIINARYIKLVFTLNAAGTANLRINQVAAIEQYV